MKGEVNRAEAHQSEGGLIPLYHFNVGMATAQFRFDIPQLAAGSFIENLFRPPDRKPYGPEVGPGLRNSANYLKSAEQSDSITLGTLAHFRHFQLDFA
jgi:hypothetical protein